MTFSQENDAATLQYGVYITPGLGMAWPEIKDLANKIYKDRIARLPWIPADWLAGVQALQAQRPDDFVRIAPSRMAKMEGGRFVSDMGAPQRNNPLFLDTDQKIDAWMSIHRDMQAAVVRYAAAQAAAGRAELNRLNANAEFWSACYKIAVFTAELPSNIASGFGGLVKDFILGDIRKNYGRTIGLVLLLCVLLLFLLKPDLAKKWFAPIGAWFARKFKGAARA